MYLYKKSIPEPFVETRPSYSSVVYHSKVNRPRSANENIEAPRPQERKTSLNETGYGKNGQTDENENLDFIQEEIAPGMLSKKVVF